MKRRQFVTWAGTLAATGTLGVPARAQAQEEIVLGPVNTTC